jgi:nicotinate-nucleotide adenylyltransferase
MHIALFFGSFNPIHIGHMIIAQSVLDDPAIHQLWFVVSPQNPLKNKGSLLPENQRYFLTQLAVNNHPKMRVSKIEFDLPKPSYTIDTLAYLHQQYPKYTFSLLMGADNLDHLSKWKNYEDLLAEYQILVYKRPHASNQNMLHHPNIKICNVPMMEISSTDIRDRIKNNLPIKYLVPDLVADEILKSGYYR